MSVAPISHQQSNSSTSQESLDTFLTLRPSNNLLSTSGIFVNADEDCKEAVQLAHYRIDMILFDMMMQEAIRKIRTAEAHLKRVEPILGPTSRLEEQLKSLLVSWFIRMMFRMVVKCRSID